MYFNFLKSNMPMNSFSHHSPFSLIVFYSLLPTPLLFSFSLLLPFPLSSPSLLQGCTEVGPVVHEVVASSDVRVGARPPNLLPQLWHEVVAGQQRPFSHSFLLPHFLFCMSWRCKGRRQCAGMAREVVAGQWRPSSPSLLLHRL
jgi:hypothetical protein